MELESRLTTTYAPLGARPDIIEANAAVWRALGRPGTWLTGAERVAIAAATRTARDCALCRERKDALSPYAVQGVHDGASPLSPAWVDAIHRMATDPGRLSRRIVDELAAQDTDDATYVELVSVTVFTMALDAFHRALGVEPLPLPEPEAGEPSRQRPELLDDVGGWVPVLSTRSPVARTLFAQALRASNAARALSLVPEASRLQIGLAEALYVPLRALAATAVEGRTLDRAQLELVASRVSALNECFY